MGVDVCYEIHPSEDLHDGATFERFLAEVNHHPRCNILFDPINLHLQQIDYLDYIDIYHERIKSIPASKMPSLIKMVEWRIYGGYQPRLQRAGRFAHRVTADRFQKPFLAN